MKYQGKEVTLKNEFLVQYTKLKEEYVAAKKKYEEQVVSVEKLTERVEDVKIEKKSSVTKKNRVLEIIRDQKEEDLNKRKEELKETTEKKEIKKDRLKEIENKVDEEIKAKAPKITDEKKCVHVNWDEFDLTKFSETLIPKEKKISVDLEKKFSYFDDISKDGFYTTKTSGTLKNKKLPKRVKKRVDIGETVVVEENKIDVSAEVKNKLGSKTAKKLVAILGHLALLWDKSDTKKLSEVVFKDVFTTKDKFKIDKNNAEQTLRNTKLVETIKEIKKLVVTVKNAGTEGLKLLFEIIMEHFPQYTFKEPTDNFRKAVYQYLINYLGKVKNDPAKQFTNGNILNTIKAVNELLKQIKVSKDKIGTEEFKGKKKELLNLFEGTIGDPAKIVGVIGTDKVSKLINVLSVKVVAKKEVPASKKSDKEEENLEENKLEENNVLTQNIQFPVQNEVIPKQEEKKEDVPQVEQNNVQPKDVQNPVNNAIVAPVLLDVNAILEAIDNISDDENLIENFLDDTGSDFKESWKELGLDKKNITTDSLKKLVGKKKEKKKIKKLRREARLYNLKAVIEKLGKVKANEVYKKILELTKEDE
ncbi:hypothetical protein ACFLZV_06535 [Candidatus Margulisiibacteriota bacterium]